MLHPGVELVLASASAARAALLRAAGLAVEIRPAAVDEAALKQAGRAEEASAADIATLLAETKALRVSRARPEAWVVGADQILVCEDRWFDKPVDLADARRQLESLRGRTHRLVTAVVCARGGVHAWHHVSEPQLTMREVSAGFLDRYLALEGEAVLGSVGGYRLEGMGVHLFDRIEGEHAAILGLPLLSLLGFLRQAGVVCG